MTETKTESIEGTSMNFAIAPPTMEDAEAIGPMHLQSWIETYQNPELGIDEAWIREKIGFVNSPMGTDFRKNVFKKITAGDDSLLYRVAKDEAGEVVGFVMASKPTEPGEPHQLDALYTLARVQGQGLGSTLMKQALDWLGEEPIELEVVAYNQHAIDFYKRYGFELLPDSEYEYKAPMRAVKMVKK